MYRHPLLAVKQSKARNINRWAYRGILSSLLYNPFPFIKETTVNSWLHGTAQPQGGNPFVRRISSINVCMNSGWASRSAVMLNWRDFAHSLTFSKLLHGCVEQKFGRVGVPIPFQSKVIRVVSALHWINWRSMSIQWSREMWLVYARYKIWPLFQRWEIPTDMIDGRNFKQRLVNCVVLRAGKAADIILNKSVSMGLSLSKEIPLTKQWSWWWTANFARW